MMKLYVILTVVLSPFIDLYLLFRKWKGKEDEKRFKERFGYPTLKRPEGRIIWVQSVSVGETNSALPFMEKLIDKYDKRVTILVTTTTVTSAANIQKKIAGNPNIVHQYSPVDKYFVVKRFLKYWKPEAFIMIESEIWPNMITLAHEYCKKVMIVNAKMSEKSFAKWKKMTSFKEKIFDSIDICYPQSEEDQFRFINLGIQNTLFLGNLKFDIPPLNINPIYFEALKNSIQGRKTITFASAHKSELNTILNMVNELKRTHKDLLFLLVLRHPDVSTYASNIFKEFNVVKKSKEELPSEDTDIYIKDTIGDMGTIFELSKIVLVCGSLVDGIGGHTPVEPAKQSCAILTGPYIFNAKSLFKELVKCNGCFIAEGKYFEKELIEKMNKLLGNEKLVEELSANAKNCVDKFDRVAENLVNNIYLNIENRN